MQSLDSPRQLDYFPPTNPSQEQLYSLCFCVKVISHYSLRTSGLFIMWGETDTGEEMKKGK